MTKLVSPNITAAEIVRLSERSQAEAQKEHRAQVARYDALTRHLYIETILPKLVRHASSTQSQLMNQHNLQ